MLSCLQSDPFYEALGYWLLFTGAVGFAAMGLDKARATRHKWRIPESTLILISIVGGSLGVAVGSAVFHHKTSKIGFLFLFLPVLIVWLVVLQWTGFLDCLGASLRLLAA